MNDTAGDLVPVETGTFDLARTDGVGALKQAEAMVHYMADKCKGPQFISVIQGRKYPKVEWWTTVGAGMGLFPQEETCVKLERDGETIYQATVGVYRGEQRVSRGSAICSNKERTWKNRDEYAIRSMALTRATGKAYRMAFSFLAVMAGLEPTPAEEMPPEEELPKTVSPQETEFLRDDLLAYLETSENIVGKANADKLREAIKKHDGDAVWLKQALDRTIAEVKRQEAVFATNTTPAAQPATAEVPYDHA